MSKGKNKAVSLVLAVLMVILCNESAFAADLTVIMDGSFYSYDESGSSEGHFNKHARFRAEDSSYGQVFCGKHGLNPPQAYENPYTYRNIKEVEDNYIRKIMYYGWKGPAEWNGFKNVLYNGKYKNNWQGNSDYTKEELCGRAVTGMSLSAYIHPANQYNFIVSGEKAFNEYISQKMTPPENFKVYYLPGNTGQQDLYVWKYLPEGSIKIKKDANGYDNLIKESPYNYSLKGAEYNIYDSRNNVVAHVITDNNGESQPVKVPEGTYYAKEIKAPAGFRLNNEPTEKVFVKDGTTSIIKHSDMPVYSNILLSVEKRTSENKNGYTLEGAEYTIKYYQEILQESEVKNKTPLKNWTIRTIKENNKYYAKVDFNHIVEEKSDSLFTDNAGDPILLPGTYTIEETKAPYGYVKNEGILSLQHYTYNNETKEEKILSDYIDMEEMQTVSITLNKTDSETGTNKPQGYGSLEGAVYEVSHFDKVNNKEIIDGNIVTDKNGTGVLNNLLPGTYNIREIKSSEGYLINNETYTIDCAAYNSTVKNFNYTVSVKEDVHILEIIKKEKGSSTGENLSGACMSIIDENGKCIEKFTTKNKPHIIKGLKEGKYLLHEEKAPEGFVKAKDIYFSVSKDNQKLKVEMEDDFTKVHILKVNGTNGKPLAGAELELRNKNNKLLYKWVTDGNGKTFNRLPAGQYFINEVKAPEGFRKAQGIKFNVNENPDLQKIIYTNKQIDLPAIIPMTGDNKKISVYFILLIIASSALVLKKILKKGIAFYKDIM